MPGRARPQRCLQEARCASDLFPYSLLPHELAPDPPEPCARDYDKSEAVALLFPEIGVVVVAVALPEARLVDRGELDAGQPLGALPEVLRRNEEPHRPAMLRGERRSVGLVDDERVLVLE